MGAMQGQAGEPAPGGVERTDSTRLRISDEDRHQVAEVLRLAAGEGRIDLDELDERLGATYAAKTYGDLVPITMDLPVAGSGPAAVPPSRPAGPSTPAVGPSTSFSMMSECKRQGVWEVPERHVAIAVMGEVTLDLREARFAGREVGIDACAVMASIYIVVNSSTRVVVDGVGIMGEFHERRSKVAAELTPDSPVVRVRGLSLMAGVSVQRKEMPGPPRKRLGRF